MAAVSLEEIDVDDCPPHGLWLDADELGAVLRRARRRVVDGG
jgi:Zn-finger nucleic acid-binding protein